MLRIAIIELMLFLLPFAAFAAYMAIAHGHRTLSTIRAEMPVGKLVVAGLALMVIGLGTLATFQRPGRDGQYHPAILKDGRIEPGRIE